jgi:hypothetical protein
MNRYPPAEVREILRREVNFGCPVKDCGSPYLQYHHFDPPWNERKHHDPKGMIALCKWHHPEADNRAWTKEQLRTMKNQPYIGTELIGRFNWLRQELIVMAGAIVHNPKVILQIGNENVVWMEKDSNGYYRLNMLVRDSVGNVVVEITNNDWIVSSDEVVDVICPPSGKELSISSKDYKTFLAIRFDDVTIDEFRRRLSQLWDNTETIVQEDRKRGAMQAEEMLIGIGVSPEKARMRVRSFYFGDRQENPTERREKYVSEIASNIGNPERVTTCKLKASLEYPKAKIQIKDGSFCSAGLRMYRGFASDAATVYSFS